MFLIFLPDNIIQHAGTFILFLFRIALSLAAAKYQVTVSDVTGRVILSYPTITPATDGSAAINLSAIGSSGVYFIRISNSNTIATLKIVKS